MGKKDLGGGKLGIVNNVVFNGTSFILTNATYGLQQVVNGTTFFIADGLNSSFGLPNGVTSLHATGQIHFADVKVVLACTLLFNGTSFILTNATYGLQQVVNGTTFFI